MRKQRNKAKGIGERNLQKAMGTGLRLNQISADWTRLMLQQAEVAREVQQGIARVSRMVTAGVSASQAQAGGLLELMGRSIRVKAGLLQQASAAADAPTVPESQTRWLDFWLAAFHLAQSNANTLARINGAAFDSWLRLVQDGR